MIFNLPIFDAEKNPFNELRDRYYGPCGAQQTPTSPQPYQRPQPAPYQPAQPLGHVATADQIVRAGQKARGEIGQKALTDSPLPKVPIQFSDT